jgi:hypothetical protein
MGLLDKAKLLIDADARRERNHEIDSVPVRQLDVTFAEWKAENDINAYSVEKFIAEGRGAGFHVVRFADQQVTLSVMDDEGRILNQPIGDDAGGWFPKAFVEKHPDDIDRRIGKLQKKAYGYEQASVRQARQTMENNVAYEEAVSKRAAVDPDKPALSQMDAKPETDIQPETGHDDLSI